MPSLIAGDIGATKTILALYAHGEDPREPLRKATFRSAAYTSLEDMISEFLGRPVQGVACAVFGVAGPVLGKTSHITNLPWVIDAGQIGAMLGTEHAYLLNDLESVALGILQLRDSDLCALNQGDRIGHGPMAVVAPGTGLGEAYLTWDGTRYRAHASEGGHADFAPRNARETDLLAYLLERHDHVSYERVCSGSGIPNIYAFLRDRGYYEEPAWLRDELMKAEDPTVVIRQAAQDSTKQCKLCIETIRMFISILGAETGNLALKVLSTGGIYLGGGLPPRLLRELQDGSFLDSFAAKGRLTGLLRRIPIHVILNTETCLMGAAGYGMDVIHHV